MKYPVAGSLIVVMLAAPLYAQTAKVVALSPADAKDAKFLYEQRDNINKRISEFQQKVADKYLSEEKRGPSYSFIGTGVSFTCGITINSNGTVAPCPPPTPAEKAAADAEEEKRNKEHHLERLPGWSQFEFSNDFRFVVPVEPNLHLNNYGSIGGCGVFTGNYVNPVSFSSVTLSKQ